MAAGTPTASPAATSSTQAAARTAPRGGRARCLQQVGRHPQHEQQRGRAVRPRAALDDPVDGVDGDADGADRQHEPGVGQRPASPVPSISLR
ncbi:hypothetical protein BKD26_02225 [Streptomyces sp. CB03238]|nr:hypothetical protein BKD26_02225 [Streptomyces sp. CB03238]